MQGKPAVSKDFVGCAAARKTGIPQEAIAGRVSLTFENRTIMYPPTMFERRTAVRLFLITASAAALAGCESDPRYGRETEYLGGVTRIAPPSRPPFDNVSYWDGDGIGGPPRVVIRLGEQRAYFYKGDQLVGVSLVSTGREGHDTTTGNFKVIQKDKDHRSNLYGDYVDASGHVVVPNVDVKRDPKPPGTQFLGAPMPYFMRIVGGTGMHAGYLPGYPASHGCIRMPEFMAENFFANVSKGTPVSVTP